MNKQGYLWKIGAPAGFGVMTTGLAMSKLAARHGFHMFDYTEYPSLIQGGHNTYEVHISSEPVSASTQAIDWLVCLNAQTYELHQSRLSNDSFILFDPAVFEAAGVATDDLIGQPVAVPFQQLLDELKAPKISLNMVALGASLACMGGNLDVLMTMIEEQFGKKSVELIEQNQAVARAGYEYVREHHAEKCQEILKFAPPSEPGLVLAGNDAFSLAAVAADVRLYAAYPMSPSSSVLANLAAWSEQMQFVSRHAEDEIGVINEALGASFAGVRAAVGTSGGGYALMTESISYAGVAEIPLVIFLAQRPGPATGMPTWTEQGDLLFTVYAGHGEFPKIILAPGDVEEMLELSVKAFNLADMYQTPVTVLSDKVLSESHVNLAESAVRAALGKHPLDRGKTISRLDENSPQPYQRYASSEDGISPRLLPGTPGSFYQANSYEHLADSHTSEDAQVRVEQVDKRARKIQTYLEKDFQAPEVFGDLDLAQIVLVSWGSNKGAIRAAQAELSNEGMSTAFVHFSHVFPLAKDQVAPLLTKDKPYLLIENNSTAQFGQLLAQHVGTTLSDKLLKYDGRPFFTEEIVSAVRARI